MNFSGTSMAAANRALEFGRTYVVKPKGKHQATIVWLHGLGDTGLSWSQALEALPIRNIKWICPTAPTRSVSLFGGFPSTAWFDVSDLSENSIDDVESMDLTASHVETLLSTEPSDIKLGVGGFSMGAASALYAATCFASGKLANGRPFPPHVSCVVGLSGWLPSAKTMGARIGKGENALRRAASLPVLLCHGKGDDVVPYKFGEKSYQALIGGGFGEATLKTYNGLGHYTNPEEMEAVSSWLSAKLGLTNS